MWRSISPRARRAFPGLDPRQVLIQPPTKIFRTHAEALWATEILITPRDPFSTLQHPKERPWLHSKLATLLVRLDARVALSPIRARSRLRLLSARRLQRHPALRCAKFESRLKISPPGPLQQSPIPLGTSGPTRRCHDVSARGNASLKHQADGTTCNFTTIELCEPSRSQELI